MKVLKIIVATEDDARKTKQKAQENAQLAIENAQNAGKEAIAATLSRAETEVLHLIHLTDRKATEEAKVLASKTANRQATQRARAERLLDSAADMIVERIVNG